MRRLLTQSVDGPYVLMDLGPECCDWLWSLEAHVQRGVLVPGLLGLVVSPHPALTVRYASALTHESVVGYQKLFGDELNHRGPHFLTGYQVKRVHVSVTGFWLYAVDASDETHLPEPNRSDEVPFTALVGR